MSMLPAESFTVGLAFGDRLSRSDRLLLTAAPQALAHFLPVSARAWLPRRWLGYRQVIVSAPLSQRGV
jgi:hypothetical protein